MKAKEKPYSDVSDDPDIVNILNHLKTCPVIACNRQLFGDIKTDGFAPDCISNNAVIGYTFLAVSNDFKVNGSQAAVITGEIAFSKISDYLEKNGFAKVYSSYDRKYKDPEETRHYQGFFFINKEFVKSSMSKFIFAIEDNGPDESEENEIPFLILNTPSLEKISYDMCFIRPADYKKDSEMIRSNFGDSVLLDMNI
jgi:hypothetical protein